jgi:YgiT-type zinc finger domain-containing protein
MVHHKVCPTCGSREIRKVRRTLTRTFRGRSYKVPRVEYHSCPRCGEEVFSPEAVRKIQACSPAFRSSRAS